MIIFNLNDGKTYEMEDSVCNMSNILKEMYYDNIDMTKGETKQDNQFDIEWIDLNIMEKYNTVCQLFLKKTFSFESISTDEFLETDINKELEFENVKDLFTLLNLANFLDNQSIIKLIHFKIDKELETKEYDKIVKKYDIEEEISNNIEFLNKKHILNDLVLNGEETDKESKSNYFSIVDDY